MSTIPLTFVSSNKEKFREYTLLLPNALLRQEGIRVVEPQELSLALLVHEKIERVKPWLGTKPFFVEHTAFSIDAWAGLPGTLISAFMDRVGPKGICKMMTAYEREAQRVATVTVAIGLRVHQQTEIFEASRTGVIAPKPRGEKRFTWDRIFIPKDPEQDNLLTYAEMGLDKKNSVSARSIAAQQMWSRYLEIISAPVGAFQNTLALQGAEVESRAQLDARIKTLTRRISALYTDHDRALLTVERQILRERIEEHEQERKAIWEILTKTEP